MCNDLARAIRDRGKLVFLFGESDFEIGLSKVKDLYQREKFFYERTMSKFILAKGHGDWYIIMDRSFVDLEVYCEEHGVCILDKCEYDVLKQLYKPDLKILVDASLETIIRRLKERSAPEEWGEINPEYARSIRKRFKKREREFDCVVRCDSDCNKKIIESILEKIM